MADMSAITGAYMAFKGLKEIAQSVIALRDAAAFHEKMFELNDRLMDAQAAALETNQERAALVETVAGLKKELADLKAWDAEKQRYELTERSPGAFAYRVKEAMQGAEPPHYICANCYQHGQKAILNTERGATYDGRRCTIASCPSCKTKFRVND